MKTKLLFLFAWLMLVITGCSADEPRTELPDTPSDERPEEPVEPSGDKKVLVVYFSHTGNTRTIAGYIHETVKSDLVEIKTVETYTDDYDTLLEQIRKEMASEYCPPLTTKIENISSLDVVFMMPHEIQSMLLWVLQENVYTPIGSDRERISDVRVISATNENMELAIKEGRFMEDLYHRLNEFEIRQPSLEECPEDIIPLAEFFRERFSKELKRETQGFTEETKQRMLIYRWLGNVRELQNRVKRAVLVSESPMLDMDGLETAVRVYGNEKTDTTAILPLKDEAFEKESIIRALKACNGHREQAARMLNINPATLYRKMKKYGLK